MIKILVILVLLLIPTIVLAQDLEPNAVFAGIVANADQSSTQTIQFSGAFRKQISGPFYSMTFWDVSGVTLKPLNLSYAQYSGSQALTYKLYTPRPWVSLWLLGVAGLTGTDGVATGSQFGGGGYVDFDFGKRIHALVMPKVTKNTLTGTAFETRIYIGTSF